MRPGHFARENSTERFAITASSACFNEARAFRPGKPGLSVAGRGNRRASMRPGHFARENSPAALQCVQVTLLQ